MVELTPALKLSQSYGRYSFLCYNHETTTAIKDTIHSRNMQPGTMLAVFNDYMKLSQKWHNYDISSL